MLWRRVAAAVSGRLRAWSRPVWEELAPLLGPLGRRWAALPRGWRAVIYPLGVALMWRLAAEQGLASADGSRYGEIILVAGLQTMPLLLSWQRPLIALAPVLLGSAIAAGTWSVFPVAGFVALGIALYAVGVRHERKVAIVTGVLAVAAVLPSAGNSYSGLGLVVPPLVAGISATSLVVADNVRSRRLAEEALAEQQSQYQEAQARRAVLEERSRIARELHDVVAHHMSMIAVQAETAPYRISGLPEESRRDYAAIGETARGALTEMRRLLGVLRSEGEGAGTSPQPGLDQLDDLVRGARSAGMPVRLSVRGTPAPVPAAIGLSAYRIVQEALSNAGRHAPGAEVEVVVGYCDERLEVTVTDGGRGAAGPPVDGPVVPRHGLLGMSERVTMLGGVLEAGPRPGGGFRVHAGIPIEADRGA